MIMKRVTITTLAAMVTGVALENLNMVETVIGVTNRNVWKTISK